MNIKKHWFAALSTLVLFGCAEVPYGPETPPSQHIKVPRKLVGCNYDQIQGTEIVFTEYGRGDARLNMDLDYIVTNLNHPKSSDHTGMRAKIRPDVIEVLGSSGGVREIVVENCDLLYVNNSYLEITTPVGVVYQEDINKQQKQVRELSSLINKNIWIGGGPNITIKTKDAENIEVGNFEEVKVLSVAGDFDLQPLFGSRVDTVYFEVLRKNGQTGYYPYVVGGVALRNPFPSDWPQQVVDLIQHRRAKVGMKEKQALLAWGLPKRVNRTTTARGSSEQWVYESGSYLYLDNGIVSAIQN